MRQSIKAKAARAEEKAVLFILRSLLAIRSRLQS
jgi:hypothetical protein